MWSLFRHIQVLCVLAACVPACINGGICIGTNTCQCIPDVWTGPYCQTRKFARHRMSYRIVPSHLALRILWTFDNSLQDLYNNFPGVGVKGPTYSSPGITGFGQCIYLNATVSQSVIIYSPPFLNMAFTSFTLLAWVKATTFHNTASGPYSDNAIFGQSQQNIQDHSLFLIVRNQRIYLGFFANDIAGNIFLSPGNWYHVCTFFFALMRQCFCLVIRLDGICLRLSITDSVRLREWRSGRDRQPQRSLSGHHRQSDHRNKWCPLSE